MRTSLIAGAIAFTAVLACGRIEGEVTVGEGASARPAPRLRVTVVEGFDEYYARCEQYRALSDSIPIFAREFADSIRRVNQARPPAERVPRATLENNISSGAYGDTTGRGRWLQSKLQYENKRAIRWEGFTDDAGRFATGRLSRGEYVVVIGGWSNGAEVKLFGASTVQESFIGFAAANECLYGEP